MTKWIMPALLMALASCSNGDDPKALGNVAATSEKAYYVFQKNADAHAYKFMKAWHQACVLAKHDDTSPVRDEFIEAYTQGLQDEPGAAAQKPLQKYVRDTWWKSGTGCQTVPQETPADALK